MADTFEPLTGFARKAVLNDMAFELAHILGVPRSARFTFRKTVEENYAPDGAPVLWIRVESPDWFGGICIRPKPHLLLAGIKEVGGNID